MTNKVRGFEVAKGFEDKEINLPIRATEGSAGYDFEAAEDITIPSIWDVYKKALSIVNKVMGKEMLGKDNLVTDYALGHGFQALQDNPEDLSPTELIQMMTISLKIVEKLGKVLDVDFDDLESLQNFDLDSLSEISGEEAEEFFVDIFSDEGVQTLADIKTTFKPVLVPTGIKAYMQNGEYLQIVNRSSNPLKKGLILTNGVGVIDKDYYNNPDNDGHIMGQFLNFGWNPVTIKKGERIFQGIFQIFLTADDDNATGERVGGHGSTSN